MVVGRCLPWPINVQLKINAPLHIGDFSIIFIYIINSYFFLVYYEFLRFFNDTYTCWWIHNIMPISLTLQKISNIISKTDSALLTISNSTYTLLSLFTKCWICIPRIIIFLYILDKTNCIHLSSVQPKPLF